MGDRHQVGVDAAVFDALLSTVRDAAIVVADANGIITYVSPSARRLLGFEAAAVVGTSLLDYVHPDDVEEVLAGLARWTDRSGHVRGRPHRLRSAGGAWVLVDYDVAIVEHDNPFGHLFLSLWPAEKTSTAERELWMRLQNEDRLTRLATSFVHVAPEDFDQGLAAAVRELGTLEWVTRVTLWRGPDAGKAFVLLHSWSASADAPSGELPARVDAPRWRLGEELANGREVSIVDFEALDESWNRDRLWFGANGVQAVLGVPITDGTDVRGALVIESTLEGRVFDATHLSTLRTAAGILAQAFARSDAEAMLAYRAGHDQLTGLGNRWYVHDHLEQALARNRHPGPHGGVAAVILDLDRFKVINDSLGHEAGDEVICGLAHRLAEQVDPACLIGRFGGDEIVVIATGVADLAGALDVARGLQELVEAPLQVAGHELFVSASVGVSFTDQRSVSAAELLQRADAAVTSAKVTGRRGIEAFDDRLARAAATRLRMENDVRRGVQERQFTIHFQPEVDLKTGEVVGAEALLRWNHPTDGLVAAGAFMVVAEETAAILELGPWVLREACAVAASWPRRAGGDPMTVRVNLSVRELLAPQLVDTVQAALTATQLAPAALCLEITETALMADADLSLDVLTRLRALGVSLAVDDFGIGYSSLSYLKRFPVDVIKIDRSFVSGIGTDPDDTAIVRAVLGLADAMGLAVTAEGIEDQRQHDELVALGCRFGQGYLLGRPMAVDDLRARL
jgi:diguanylate cyclase (GGDEF)-like protein/PAS domain S-box-containing protein